jgi:arylsulfatase A
MRWPVKIAAGSVCSEIATTMDILPTLAHITGAPLETHIPIDGKNIMALLDKDKHDGTSPHEYFFYGELAVRWGDWKYHAKEKFKVKSTARPNNGPSLYKLKDDIGESKNVIAQYPEVAERLRSALASNPNKRSISKKRKKRT